MHPDTTQAIFTSVASFNALTKSDTIPRVSRSFPSKSRFPEHTTVIGQYYFRFERNNAMNAMETLEENHVLVPPRQKMFRISIVFGVI
jgi:hypothetical protein